ncbi:TetR/AcrR family transcriptional regulator [Aquibium oceanicum]|uniref:HTH tetR-type domain-containing protein n=1 Tax=Aquibium oceanicum TaxID=1670800 RepID=A0A1L3SQW2_9HYPH|nr:TetR/AcrR family transcriptional regulator [Aquibium oceanicum]APH71682.1 hypothetical protein BSQ44_10115 [Aquibium oceanicum]
MRPTARSDETTIDEAGNADHRTRNGMVRREQTRRKLMAAAVAVFSQKSPDAASIDDFIAQAGVSRGTFYNHFRSTHELLQAVNAAVSDGVLEVIDKMVLTFDDPLERIAAGCLAYMSLAIENRAWGRFIVQVGTQGEAGGKLVDVYLPRDIEMAAANGDFRFSAMQVAHDAILGGLVRSIQSVILGRTQPDHVRETLMVAFVGLGVDAERARRVCWMEVPKLPISGDSDFSALISE